MAYEAVPAGAALHGCIGYWAYFPTGGSLEPGASAASCSLALMPGHWILAGGPSAQTAGVLSGDYVALTYTQAAGYQPASIVPIGRGIWVTGSGTLTISAGSGPYPAP
ncbi:MAG: hypothetical protein ACYDCQ_08505 [Dehalococcoidia bacterium]